MSALTPLQLQQITEAVRAGFPNEPHDCTFSAEDRENIHDFCGILRNGGTAAIREMVTLFEQINASKKIAGGLIIAAIVGGVLTAIGAGVKAILAGLK